MKTFLNNIRTADRSLTIRRQIINTICIFVFGAVLGTVSKWLDCTASNELPRWISELDLRNFFSRISIWLFIGTAVSIYSKTPLRAAVNVFIFFAGMLISYYAYTKFIAGFFPVSYILIWVVLTLLSPVLAAVCWYARGKGIPALLLSAAICSVLFRCAFVWGMWYFDMLHPLEALTWLAGIAVLYRSPKQLAAMTALSLIFAFFGQLVLPIIY